MSISRYGELPERWVQTRFKTLFTLKKGLSITKENLVESGVPCVNYGQIHSKYGFEVNPDKNKLPFVDKGYLSTNIKSLMSYGDFVFADTSEDMAGSGNFTYLNSQTPVFAGYHTIIAQPKRELNYRYIAYYFDSPFFRSQVQKRVNGVKVYSITRTILNNTFVAFPPRDEQDQIVRYLNWKVSGINRLINAKRRQIALLQEQKRGVINEAVTKGGKGWEQRRIKATASILRGKFSHRPRNDPAFYDGEYPFIQTGDVARADKYIRDYRQTLNGKGYSVSKLFPKGTLTMTIAANIGDVAILDFDACFPDSIIGFIPHNGIDLEYLYYAFFSMKAEFVKEAPVNTQGNLNVERVGAMTVHIPQEDRQREIVCLIENSTSNIDSLICKLTDEIILFSEYRTRLISDVVTGKIDVRGVVVPDYEAVEDVAEEENKEEIEDMEIE